MRNVSSEHPVQCRATPRLADVANQGYAARTIFVGVKCVENLGSPRGVPSERGARIEVVGYFGIGVVCS